MNSDLFCIHQIHNMIKSKTDYPVWLTSAFSRKIYQVTKKKNKKKKRKILSSSLEYRQGGNKAKNFC